MVKLNIKSNSNNLNPVKEIVSSGLSEERNKIKFAIKKQKTIYSILKKSLN